MQCDGHGIVVSCCALHSGHHSLPPVSHRCLYTVYFSVSCLPFFNIRRDTVDVTSPDSLQASFARSWASSTSPQDPSPKEPEKKDYYDHATGMERFVSPFR